MNSTYQTIVDMINNNHGRFMSITFRKKDGSWRVMNIQPAAVKTHLAVNPSPSALQGAATRKANHPNLIPVYDVQAKAIRSINVDTIRCIKANKIVFNTRCLT